jgi:hypothetical protein
VTRTLYRLMLHTIIIAGDVPSSTDQGSGSGGVGTSGSGHFQTAQAKLIDRLGARLSFILGIYGDSADKPQN